MGVELIHALEQLEKEKGVDKDVLIEAIEAALISAYKRNFGSTQEVRISFDKATGDVQVFSQKKIVENPNDAMSEISLEQARRIDAGLGIDDIAEIEVTPRKFGRIAAQTAKQVVVQRIREAERDIIFDTFSSREEDIVTGIVNRFEKKNVVLDVGKAEAILPEKEQSRNEDYRYNDRIKTYVTEVKKTPKGPQIIVSRTHPGLVKRLFELEVPEIGDGTVEIRSISREAGSRTKIAVFSRDDNVDPVGACVGQKGTRVQAIVDELRGEKIDIIKWSANPVEFLSSSLSPAKVVRVDLSEDEKIAEITVPDFQLSLAIGKEGQNARLAAKLTGWKIDIRSESQLREEIERQLLNYDRNYDYDDGDIDDENIDGEDFDGENINDEDINDEDINDEDMGDNEDIVNNEEIVNNEDIDSNEGIEGIEGNENIDGNQAIEGNEYVDEEAAYPGGAE